MSDDVEGLEQPNGTSKEESEKEKKRQGSGTWLPHTTSGDYSTGVAIDGSVDAAGDMLQDAGAAILQGALDVGGTVIGAAAQVGSAVLENAPEVGAAAVQVVGAVISGLVDN